MLPDLFMLRIISRDASLALSRVRLIVAYLLRELSPTRCSRYKDVMFIQSTRCNTSTQFITGRINCIAHGGFNVSEIIVTFL